MVKGIPLLDPFRSFTFHESNIPSWNIHHLCMIFPARNLETSIFTTHLHIYGISQAFHVGITASRLRLFNPSLRDPPANLRCGLARRLVRGVGSIGRWPSAPGIQETCGWCPGRAKGLGGEQNSRKGSSYSLW